MLARADAALYAAKSGGRNRVLGTAGERVAAPAPEPAPETTLLRRVVGVTRTAIERRGARPLLEQVAELVRAELRFATAVVNLRREDDSFETVVVLGDEEARSLLLGQVSTWESWQALLAPRHQRCGAYWLPAGSHTWDESVPVWTPPSTPDPATDAWLPQDALLLPLRDPMAKILGVLAVDEPLSGRRPTDDELGVLMAVADHAGLVLSLAAPAADVSRGRVAGSI
jgi:hypothetical protein